MKSFSRIIKAFGYSLSGLRYAIRNETAFGQEILLSFLLIPAVILLELAVTAKILMICSLVFILITELINSVIGRISAEKHPLSKHVKDMGSAIVLLAFIQASIIWVGFIIVK